MILVTASGLGSASEPPLSTALLELTVNGVNKGAVRVLLRGEEILISAVALEAAGLTRLPEPAVSRDGIAYVSMAALRPDVDSVYDEANLAIILTADPALLAPTTIDLGAGVPLNIEYIDSPSAFINYAFISENVGTPIFLSEQSARLKGALFNNAFSIGSSGEAVRGDTSVTFDNRTKARRLVLGDAIADGGILGGIGRIGGVSYLTDFTLTPYVTPFPNQRFAGVVSTPSTADVYVNGRLVRTVDVPPGVFNLENLPGVSGAGNVRVVVRNAFGQAQELSAPYYMGTQLLRQGLNEFSYHLGFEREQAIRGIGGYGGPALTAHHRYGFSDTLSLGGFAVATDDTAAAGPEATVGLPFGTLGLSLAGSRQGGRSGAAAAMQYTYQSARFSAGAAYAYTSPRYATLGLRGSDDRATARFDGFVGIPIGAASNLSLDVTHARYRDAGVNTRAALSASTRLGGRLSLSATLAHAKIAGLPVDNSAFVSLTMALGPQTAATASISHDRRGTTAAVQIQKSLPIGEGLGYLVQAASGPQAVNLADVQYQGKYGLYRLDVVQVSGDTRATVSASGGLVVIGGRIMPTRPIEDAFALIRVPGVAGVTGTLSHQPVGKTDSQGDLLVPNLLSYYGNELGISDIDIPLDYSIAQTDRAVAPSYRGGAVVEFPVRRLQAYVGSLEIRHEGTSVIPAYGDLSVQVESGLIESPIGARGEFYLEGLSPGEASAEIRYESGRCRFILSAPASEERFVQLGKLTCVQDP